MGILAIRLDSTRLFQFRPYVVLFEVRSHLPSYNTTSKTKNMLIIQCSLFVLPDVFFSIMCRLPCLPVQRTTSSITTTWERSCYSRRSQGLRLRNQLYQYLAEHPYRPGAQEASETDEPLIDIVFKADIKQVAFLKEKKTWRPTRIVSRRSLCVMSTSMRIRPRHAP